MTLVSERIGQFFHDGHRLEYTEYGGGDRWVVLIHGQLMPRRMQQPLARHLAGTGAHVVTVDLLGHGRSDRPDDPLDYSMTAFGEQVISLLDNLGIDQAVIGGTSLGANVSLEVAVLAPERVRGIIAEMPVLDNALEAGILAFAPLLFAARFLPLSISGLRAVTRVVPRGWSRSGPASCWTPATSARPRWLRPSTASSSAGSPPRRALASRSRSPRWWWATSATRSTPPPTRPCWPRSCRTPRSSRHAASSSGGYRPQRLNEIAAGFVARCFESDAGARLLPG